MQKIKKRTVFNITYVLPLLLWICFFPGKEVLGQAFFNQTSPEETESGHFGYWNFNSFVPGSSTKIPADFDGSVIDSLEIDLSGFTGTVDNFDGNTSNALGGDPAGASLSLVNQSGNGSFIQIETSMRNLRDLEISYWSRRTNSGFDNNQWSYSLDGINFTDFGPIINPSTASSGALVTIDASGLVDINGEEEVYLRYTVNGATTAVGNNRIDNLRLTATYEASGPAGSPEIPYDGIDQSVNPYTDGWIHRNVTGPGQRWSYNPALGVVRMNAFSGGCQLNDDWLISPPFNMDAQEDEVLSFETAENFSGTDLELLYSIDYDGVGNPTDFSWTNLATIVSGGSGLFVDSTLLNVISGSNVFFAFRYQFQSVGCSQWDVSSFSISLPLTTAFLEADPAMLSNFDYFFDEGPSSPQTFSLSGSNLDGSDVTIDVPANFKASFEEVSGYDSQLILDSYDGEDTTIYVRLVEGLSVGTYSGMIEISGGGADTIDVLLSGAVGVDYDYIEPFDNYPETGASYNNGDFIGVLGNQWDYTNGRGTPQIDGPTVVLQNNSAALLETTLNTGISDFSFDYLQAFGTNVNLEVHINGDLVATVTSDGEQSIVKNSGNISVNYPGVFSIEFKQGSGGGQVAIDNFSWKGIPPDPLTLQTDTIIHVSCFGAADGAISIEVEGGVPPYSFSWEGPDEFSSADSNIVNLAAGTYDLVLTDQLDSTVVLSVLIEQPDLLEASWITEDVSCFQGSDGSIQFISPTGGSGNYEFSIDGGETWADALLFPGLMADTFDLRMRDADIPTCEVILEAEAVITQPSDFSSTFTFLFSGEDIVLNDGDTICAGIEATRIYLQSTEGDAPLEIVYSVNDGFSTDTFTNTGIMPNDESVFILAFGPGPFEVILISITDDNGCQSLAQEGFTFYVVDSSEGAISSNPDSVSAENGTQFEIIFSAEISGCDVIAGINLEMEFDPDFIEVIDIEAIDWNTGESQSTSSSIDNMAGNFFFEAFQLSFPFPSDTIFEFVKVTFEAKQTTGDSVTMLGYKPAGLGGGTGIFGFNFIDLAPLQDIPIHIFGCDDFDITTASVISCFGESGGGAEVVSVSGGTAPYSFLWNTGDTTQVVDSLAAGTYTVTITDAEGCSDTATVTVNERDSITITVIVEDADCFGGEGTLSINGSGAGQSFFSFTVNDESIGGSSGAIVISRPPGEYEIVGTANVNGCQKTAFAVVEQPDSIELQLEIFQPTCEEQQPLGTVTFDPIGGTGNIVVTLNEDTVTSPLSLGPGFHDLVYFDENGCEDTVTVEIIEPDFVILTLDSLINATCFGENGIIGFSGTGGSGSLTYTLNGDEVSSPVEVPAGMYTLIASDGICTDSLNLTVTEPDSITVNVSSVIPPNCFGEEGSLTFSASGGGAFFFEFTVNDENVGSSSGNISINRPAGEYEIVATSGDGCEGRTTVNIIQPDSLELNVHVTQPTCEEQQPLGTVTFNPIGGTGDIVVTLNENTVTSPLSLAPGFHDLVYFDENGCEDTVTVEIIEPNFVILTLDSLINATCFGENGIIGFSGTGGSGSLTYTLNGDEVSSPVEVPAGMYTLIASDGVCTDSLNLTVTEPDSITVNVSSVIPPNCFGEEGSLTFSASGGGAFFFEFTVNDENVGSSSGNISINRPAGEYEIVATSGDGCESRTTLNITQPDSLVLNAIVANPDCENELGQISFDPQGGTGSITVFLGDTVVSSPLHLPAGNYVFELIDENQCSNTESVSIQVIDPFSITGQAFDVLCHGDNGLLTFSGQGGLGNVSFFIDDVEVESPLEVPAGTYTILGVASESGCEDSLTLEVNQPDPIELVANAANALCFGEEGSISISASGGNADFFSFTVNEEFVGSSSVTINRPAGEYMVSVMDANECFADTTVIIGQPDSLILIAEVSDAPCFEEEGTVLLSAEGGTEPYLFTMGDDTVESPLMLLAGGYSIELMDANGCTDATEIDIGQPDPVNANFAINGELINEGDTLKFTNVEEVIFTLDEILSGFAPFSIGYSISEGNSSSNFNSQDLEEDSEIFNLFFEPATYDIAILEILDNNDCQGSSMPYLSFVLEIEDAVFPLQGNVDILSSCADREIELFFYSAGTDELMSSQSAVLDSMGNFSIEGVIAGNYDVFAKIEGFLQKGIAAVTVAEDNIPELNFNSLIPGDVNGDNQVGQDDLDLLLDAYNTLSEEAAFDRAADLNCDGKVDINDLTELIKNFGKAGDQPGQL